MACGLALKRSHGQYETYLSDDGYSNEAKRARTTQCQPFRPQMGTIAAHLPSTSTNFEKNFKKKSETPFVSQHELTDARLTSYLNSEIKVLQRRKAIQKNDNGDASSSPMSVYRAPVSPKSESDSEGENAGEARSSRRPVSVPSNKAHFSLQDVHVICSRLLKEQEARLVHQFESILQQKLNEQHEQYVQYATEQFTTSNKSQGDDYSYSYLS